ncbi:MAG: PAS domain S-box protein, partial [Burkholderiales bacterium]|nr:PAS domain S-box protein [Burkholderiales bacterium]
TYIRKNGTRLPVVVSVTALRDAGQKIIGYLLISNDNTARKQANQEQALLEQRWRDQQFYTRSLIESNTDALIATNPRGIISDVNRQMEALTGCTRHELIGAPFKNFFTDQASAESAINRVLHEGKVTDFELTACAKDGRETLVSYSATTFHDRERKLQGVFAAARDITERKRFELTLEQNNIELKSAKAQAEKANLAKSEFLSRMSHELRTPLNAVLGFGQLMASSQPPPTGQQKVAIEQILQAGWYLLHLINEVLDLATIEAGKLSMTQEPMSFSAVLQDCQAMITLQAQKRCIQMHFPNFDQLFYVHADRIRVKQMMINLLSNAIKYNVDGGSVWVTCEMREEQQVRVSVADSGRGMTSSQIAHLFQPFNRLGQEASCEEGTGIGLVVTKQLVELMGGEMGVSSEVGVGSVFWVSLTAAQPPLHAAPNAMPVAVASSKSSAHASAQTNAQVAREHIPAPPHRVLYVEDNAANLALVEQLLARRDDLILHTASNSNNGLRLARNLQPDLIVMDMNLPGISGLAALTLLRDDPATAHIPVLALSANALAHDIEKGLRAGFFRYLTKPIRVDEFMLALEQTLEHIKHGNMAATAAKNQPITHRHSPLGAHTDA